MDERVSIEADVIAALGQKDLEIISLRAQVRELQRMTKNDTPKPETVEDQ